MKTQETIRTTVTFVVLFTAGVLMMVGAFKLAEADVQSLLYPLGAAFAGAALAFFLIEIFRIERETGPK